MTNEEKKAIEKLKNTSEQCHNSKECWENEDCTDCYVEVEDIMAIDTVLNLLEEQQKEIEELKEKNMHITKETVDFINSHYIHKDKIKAKIEEKFLEAKGLYERGVQPQAQYTMKMLRDLEKSLLEKEY